MILDIWYGSRSNYMFSNLSERRFIYDCINYFSVEHAYQSLKSGKFDKITYDKYKSAGVKIVGFMSVDKINSISLMKKLIFESFVQNKIDAKALIDTGDDIFSHEKDRSIWRYEFPRLLMEVRDELKEKKGSAL